MLFKEAARQWSHCILCLVYQQGPWLLQNGVGHPTNVKSRPTEEQPIKMPGQQKTRAAAGGPNFAATHASSRQGCEKRIKYHI